MNEYQPKLSRGQVGCLVSIGLVGLLIFVCRDAPQSEPTSHAFQSARPTNALVSPGVDPATAAPSAGTPAALGGTTSVTVTEERCGLHDSPAGQRFYFVPKGETFMVVDARQSGKGMGAAAETWWFEINYYGTTGWVSQWDVKANRGR